MLEIRLCFGLNLGNDALSQNLSQFHSPLIEGINLPDSSLNKDAVLVQCNQIAQRRWSQLTQQDRVGGPIAFEGAMRRKPSWCAVGLDLLRSLAKSQCLSLRENICQ